MSQLRRYALRGLGTAAALTAITLSAGGSAWAHECYVASRSAQGDASAGAHSAAWDYVTLDTVLTQFIGVPQDVADCVEGLAPAAGIPSSFVLGGKQAQGSYGVIAENNKNMVDKGLASNGTGIDHAEDVYGEAIGALIGQCTGG